MTPTGSQRLRQSFGDTVNHVYMPYDLPWTLSGFIRKVQPRCLIIMETELWPNLLDQCKKRNIPTMIVNGRLSDKSFRGYLRIRSFVSQVLQQVSFVAVQTKLDARRFMQLGLASDKVQISGNLKYDVQIPVAQQQLGKALKASFGQRLVWVAASTHAGEEEQILSAFKLVQAQRPECLLVLVPRHPDRFNEVAHLLDRSSLSYVRRSQVAEVTVDTAVLLGDTMGELNVFYNAADIAFVGGSLIPFGGHNTLEPAACGVATITGPHVNNFREITDKLQSAGALSMVQDAQQLAAKVLEWLGAADVRNKVGAQGLAVIAQNKGAVVNVMHVIAANY